MKDLLLQLIRARSTIEPGEQAAAEVIANHFQRYGVECRIDSWGQGRANVIARVPSARKRPGLLFVCHLDVVGPGEDPWTYPAFEGREVNGKVYGRGAVDMKGGIAAVVDAICEVVASGVKLQGDIVFAATAGEETDSAGVQRFAGDLAWLGKPAGVIIPEPTDLAVVTAHRGLFWLEITTKGKAVHSSMPQRGVNAIVSMRRVIEELERYEVDFPPHPELGKCTVSINTIHGGEAMNIVPDRCAIGVDIRTLPGQDTDAIRYDIERLLARLTAEVPRFEATVAVIRTAGALETDPDCEFVQRFCSAVDVDLTNAIGFTTDAPHLTRLGAPIVIFGPGKPNQCHQVDEHIAVADLEAGHACFKEVLLRFLT
ncbi:MAG TPA: M20 family metallopeptidase [Sedimentisphaerales bacterium]|nr:M20 family metallopeptidase [Sedimentisphaerales bacterium]HRS10806.1 M20 family metallopeptidase [Sedimentisphaerales bacterium]HRV47512.1 M20 family metallopeptidase [Sedimentisphaerales bacterium]